MSGWIDAAVEAVQLRAALAAAQADNAALREAVDGWHRAALAAGDSARAVERERDALAERLKALEEGLRGIETMASISSHPHCRDVAGHARALLKEKP